MRDSSRDACDGVDRQVPEEPRHRLRRRLPRALARPEHAVRGDDERARRRRPRRQGPLRRPLELQARGDQGVHGHAPDRRRAVRLEHVRPAHAAARSCPYCAEQGVGFMAYGGLSYGLLTGTFTEDHDFGSADWRVAPGQHGRDQGLRRALRSREVQGQRARGERAEGRRRPVRQEPCRSSRCGGRSRTRP